MLIPKKLVEGSYGNFVNLNYKGLKQYIKILKQKPNSDRIIEIIDKYFIVTNNEYDYVTIDRMKEIVEDELSYAADFKSKWSYKMIWDVLKNIYKLKNNKARRRIWDGKQKTVVIGMREKETDEEKNITEIPF